MIYNWLVKVNNVLLLLLVNLPEHVFIYIYVYILLLQKRREKSLQEPCGVSSGTPFHRGKNQY